VDPREDLLDLVREILPSLPTTWTLLAITTLEKSYSNMNHEQS
jgi:hypothetical protein